MSVYDVCKIKGGPIEGMRLPLADFGPAFTYQSSKSPTRHLYRIDGSNDPACYRYVGVVEEAKK